MREFRKKYPEKMFKIWIITASDPTAEQVEVVKKYRSKIKCAIVIEGFASFSSKVVDGRDYLEIRKNHYFGSIRDPKEDRNVHLPDDEFIPIDFVDSINGGIVKFDDVVSKVKSEKSCGENYLILGDYGSGKSMTLRRLYNEKRKLFISGKSTRFPVFVNLREHFGQSNPAECLMRHATIIGVRNPSELIAGWRAGFIDIFLDGFDELSSARLVRSTQGLKRARREAVALVRNFVEQTPSRSHILVTGRENYFDSKQEMKSAFDLPDNAVILSLTEFDEDQVDRYLKKKGVASQIPDWMPTRPLLLGYLAVKGFINSGDNSQDGVTLFDMGKEEGWDYLIDRICEREAKQIDPVSIDPLSVREFLERLATKARSTISGRGPINVRDMDDLYQSVFGERPDEKAEIFLLRLPGFTATADALDHREFIDDDLVDACRAGDIIRYIRDPFNFDTYLLKDVNFELGELGTRVATRRCVDLTEKQLSNSLDNSIDILDNSMVSFDIFMIMSYLGKKVDGTLKQIRGGIFRNLGVSSDCDYGQFEFVDCMFETIEADCVSGFSCSLGFRRCSILNLIGPASILDWETSFSVQDCSVDKVHMEADTNKDIFQLDLPMGVRVLLTVLRKLFIQKGSGRKESALYRGMDQRARSYVRDVLNLVERFGFAKSYSHIGPTIWIADRSKMKSAGLIIQKPGGSKASIVEEARKL